MLVFWPISFYFANNDTWPIFASAILVLLVDWILYSRKNIYHDFLYLILPLIHPAYLIFPIIAVLPYVKDMKKIPLGIYAVLLILMSLFSYKTFYAYSIFTPDPLARDTLIKKISLIPSRNLARIFENKTTVSQEKFKDNIFLSSDLNNYFFSLHPREVGGNQNLNKYPYLAIVPFLLGLFFILENIHRKWITTTYIAAVISIGLINNQDKFDVLIYLPISLLCFYGLKKLANTSTKYFWIFSLVFIPVTIIELIRMFVVK